MRTLRSRVTIVAGLAIAVAVVLGLLLMYLLQINSVRRTVDSQLRTYATQITQAQVNGGWPTPLPASTLDANAEAQVLDADGHVLAATRSLTGLPAVYQLPANSSSPVRQKAAEGTIPTDIRVLASRTTINGQPVTILTGTGTGLLSTLNGEFLRNLLIALPIILVLAATAVWLIVGRALRPVERIRRTVTAITAADLSRRIAEPATADEIGQLVHTMNDMLARLDDAARTQRRFVADASHELRSPLAAIRTTLEVGLAHPGKAPWPVIAERAAGQSARLENLVQQLLLLAKADEHQLSTHQQQFNLAELLREVLASTSTRERDADLIVATRVTMVGNPHDLQRLFRNVLDNALRYADSRVVISVTTSENAVHVTIDDDGPGIPAADRDRVFDRFTRLDASRDRGRGTAGLGLAIAREIASAHQGIIAIDDSPAGGARITISLPEGARPSTGGLVAGPNRSPNVAPEDAV